MHADIDPWPLTKRAVLVADGDHKAILTVPAQATAPHTGTNWTVLKTGNATTDWEYLLDQKNLMIAGDGTGVVQTLDYERRVPKLSQILMPGSNPFQEVAPEIKAGKSIQKYATAYVSYASGTLGVANCHSEEFLYVPATPLDPRCGAREIELKLPGGFTIYEANDENSKITAADANAVVRIENRYTGKVDDRTDHYKHYSKLLRFKADVRTIVFTERVCKTCDEPCLPTPTDDCDVSGGGGPTIECGSTNWP
jgi:hypothetical protein